MPDGPPPGIERTGEMDVVSDDEIFLPEDLSEQEPEAGALQVLLGYICRI